jgi:hypothetical protein
MTIVEQPNLPDMRASITRSDDSIASFLAPASSELDKAWSGAKPDTVKVLPVSVPAAEFMQLRQEAESHIREVEAFPKLVIGLGERFLDWAYVDYALHGPHFLIAGPARSGKTNLLRVWAWRLAERYSPAQVQLSLIGLKQRSLDDLHQLPHVKYSANNEFALDPLLEALVDEAEQRHQKLGALYKDNPTLEPSAISEGVGAAHFVLVDDFDPTHFTRDRQSRLLEFAHYGQDTKTFLVIASVSRNLLDYSELLSRLERGRSIVLLQPGDLEVRVIDVRLSSFYLRQEHPVGRGVLLLGNRPELVQTLHLDSEYLARRSENFKSHMDGMSESNLAVGGDQYPQVDSS